MNQHLTNARDMMIRVRTATRSADAGVVVELIGRQGYEHFVLWAIDARGRITDHCLDVACTDEARLTAHVEGFIANHRANFAAA